MNKELTRCEWCDKDDIYRQYHDEVWGVPIYDSELLWIKLILDGQQAGLSWYTILIRRDEYRRAFDNWNIKKIASYGEAKIEQLLNDKGIIRNKLKVNAIIKNAKAYLKMKDAGIDFSTFLWGFVGGKPIINVYEKMADVPAETDESKAMSKALKKEGFSFVGPTICYAFMQAVGMVDDHMTYCWRRSE